MSALAGLPQLTATVGTSVEAIADGVTVSHPSRDDLTHAEALVLTAEIRAALRGMAEMAERAAELVEAAWAMRADLALGYATWEAYVAASFGSLGLVRLPIPARVMLVTALAETGMARRAIGRALSLADQTVRADLVRAALPAAPVDDEPTAPEPSIVKVGGARPPTLPATALADLAVAGTRGLTSAELGKLHRDWRTGAWAVLSRLHAQHRVARLSETRGGYAAYVHPDHIAGREVEAPGRRPLSR